MQASVSSVHSSAQPLREGPSLKLPAQTPQPELFDVGPLGGLFTGQAGLRQQDVSGNTAGQKEGCSSLKRLPRKGDALQLGVIRRQEKKKQQ